MPITSSPKAVVVGAGVGGLSAAICLAQAGCQVSVFEGQAHAGGKIRQVPTDAGPADTGPTVVTMLPVFERLFHQTGARLSDYVTAHPQPHVARHFWLDGTQLDLFDDPDKNHAAITAAFDTKSADDYMRFERQTAALFDTFAAPVIEAPRISLAAVCAAALTRPRIWPALLHPTLDGYLASAFSNPHLRQLFGRYATYVGGSPLAAPALLALIWQAERRGVWAIDGGVGALAQALATRAGELGAQIHLGTPVDRIVTHGGVVNGVALHDGRIVNAQRVVFNGDPRALADGALGAQVAHAVSAKPLRKRALSAHVWAFSAKVSGPDIAQHNVFFAETPNSEFSQIAAGHRPTDPSVYLCAQDRGPGTTPTATQSERFEIILNAAPLEPGQTAQNHTSERMAQWHETCLHRLQTFGLDFSPEPRTRDMRSPQDFAKTYPGSLGSLYGQSPNSMMASFQRPTTRTKVPGLFLAGGGVHPGPGIAMACRSGMHAGTQIAKTLALPSKSRPTATHGGTSTASPIAAPMQSR